MPEPFVTYPLIIIFGAALAAFLSGLPAFKQWLPAPHLGWLLATAPLSAFLLLVSLIPSLQANLVYTWQMEWLPSVGLTVGLYFDSLSALFSLLITFIGTLVVVYAGYG